MPGLLYWDEFKPLIGGQFHACVILFVLADCPVVSLIQVSLSTTALFVVRICVVLVKARRMFYSIVAILQTLAFHCKTRSVSGLTADKDLAI